MKKIKLMAIALLAGAMGLAGCGEDPAKEPGQQEEQEQEDVKKVLSVSISSQDDKTSIKVGETLQLTASVQVEGEAKKTVSWKSSDTSVATVSADGLVTAKKADTVEITATSHEDSSKSATFTLTINEADAVISVSIEGAPADGKIKVGDTKFLQAKVVVAGDASKGVTWTTSDSGKATVSQEGVVTGVDEGSVTITATSSFDTSKSASVTLEVWSEPKVVSVSISGEPQGGEIVLHESAQLSATVVTKGGALQTVSWSSSDTSVATVDENGLVTTVGAGTFTITATSEFDGTKSATTSVITVIDHGFAPAYYDAGYTYVTTWNEVEAAVKAFLGAGDYSVEALPSLEGGAYIMVHEESELMPGCLELVVDGVRDDEYRDILMAAGYDRLYVNSYDEYEAVDPSSTFTVAFTAAYNEDTRSYEAPTGFMFYKSEDVWASSTLTEDLAWDLEKISEDSAEYSEEITSTLENIPFVAMGEEYEISYVFDYSNLYDYISVLAAYGYINESTPLEQILNYVESIFGATPMEYYEIADYSVALGVFDNYGEVLTNNGFKLVQEEGYLDYYVKNIGLDALYVTFGFNEHGNNIMIQSGVAELEGYPQEVVDAFVADTLLSDAKVPVWDVSDSTNFQAAIIEGETDEEIKLDLVLDYGTLDDLFEYQAKLELAGFEVEYSPATDEDYPYFKATWGRLVIEMVLKQVYDETTKEYLDEGPIKFLIYADTSIHETQGIFLPASMDVLLADGEFDLPLEVVGLEEPTLSIVSSDPSVATVDPETLMVTPLAGGETTITVTIPETEFEAKMVLTVAAKSLFEQEMDKVNAWLEMNGCEALELPTISCSQVAGFYNEEENSYQMQMLTDVTDAQFAAALEELGFEMSEDQWGYPLASNGEVVIGPWNYSTGYLIIDFTLVPQEEQAGATFDFSVMSTTSGEANGISFTTSIGDGQSEPAYNENNKQLRLYAKNTLTFAAASGSITEIRFECTFSNGGSLTASTGTLTSVEDGYLWEGDASEVTFTVSASGQVRITLMEVNGGGESGGGEELLTEFPMQDVITCLDGTTEESFPVPTGTGFTFEESEEYYYDCYVGVEGGDLNAYLAALAGANFEIDDEYGEEGYFYCLSEGKTLEIDIIAESNSSFTLDIYSVTPASDEFPVEEIKAYLTSLGITTQSFPIPEGDEFVCSPDDGSYYAAVYGGDASAYMSALELAGYEIRDLGDGFYAAVSGDLEIDIIDYGVEVGFELYFGEVWSL